VFNNMGTNLLLVSTAHGAGIGMGGRDYRVVIEFENEEEDELDKPSWLPTAKPRSARGNA
jgi:hypothetical protein